MSDYGNRLLDDLPQQYQDKERAAALCEVIGKQLDDVYDFYEQLKTERFISTAYGQTLDNIGSILSLTRKEARQEAGTYIQGLSNTLSDDYYRQFLTYKVVENFGDATYGMIMDCLNILQGSSLGFQITEAPDRPATIILTTTNNSASDLVQTMLQVPIPRAGGVAVVVRSLEEENLGFYATVVFFLSFAVEASSDIVDVSAVYTWYCNEDDEILADENGNILVST